MSCTDIEKLRGRENYQSWKQTMEMKLVLQGLMDCVVEPAPEAATTDQLDDTEADSEDGGGSNGTVGGAQDGSASMASGTLQSTDEKPRGHLSRRLAHTTPSLRKQVEARLYILAFCTPSVRSLVRRVRTGREVWQELHTLFGTVSWATKLAGERDVGTAWRRRRGRASTLGADGYWKKPADAKATATPSNPH